MLSKPGCLTQEEFEKMEIHPTVGSEILNRVQFPYPVVPIVRSHHEKWDGSGYPDGLRGLEIPIGARILSVVDCFDALTSERPYRRALSPEDAMKHLRSESGRSYDARVVECIERRYQELESEVRNTVESPNYDDYTAKTGRRIVPSAGLAELPIPAQVPAVSFLASIGSARQEAHLLSEFEQTLCH